MGNDTAVCDLPASRLGMGSLHWPVLLYTLVLFVVGVTGNSLVFFIYHCHLKKNVFGSFVQILAVLDMVIVFVCLPCTFLLRFAYDIDIVDASVLCKTQTFAKHFSAAMMGVVLSAIAYQRYQKACKPLGYHMTRYFVLKLCVSGICFSLITSTPIIYLIGKTTTIVKKENEYYCVPTCNFSRKHWFPLAYAIFVDVEFIAFTMFLVVTYFKIWKSLGKSFAQTGSRRVSTRVFFVSAIIYIVSGLPIMAIATWFSVHENLHTFSPILLTAFDIGLYLPYVNCVAHTAIYSMASSLFRVECRALCQCTQPQ
ncbi:mas-related G-protein coupled receptor member B4-like [Haliotis rubra]|uniref:mas-related G-protein coupled receptor member B4-like n=1 Tax=Haliotis rubra TaxID=36100 RepID=UPI001EE5745D|nr:mas-related G-protein coupled receptor member B4-like [Haliotis rubra]